jgi:peptidoglycan/LPS O-acetylase OafA/YrhL
MYLSKVHVYELDYMRAVAMLGVIGIHTGAFSIANPNVNVHFFGLVDILTRFSVPVFFFISAFGLFMNYDFAKPYDYLSFLKRRISTVLVPYLAWSFIYIAHQYWVDANLPPLTLSELGNMLFFGLGSFHLYFLVILLWFYILMPVWRMLIPVIINRLVIYLSLLYLLQTVFNYYSTNVIQANTAISWLDTLITYRLNYLILHYLFIFLLGGVCGALYPRFLAYLTTWRSAILAVGILSTAGLLGYYYELIYGQGYTCISTVFTLHQLHPLGLFYTLTTTLLLFSEFHHLNIKHGPHPLLTPLRLLGENSYVIYLVHPLFMYYLTIWINAHFSVISVPVNVFFYIAATLLSYTFSRLLHTAGSHAAVLSIFTGIPFKPSAASRQQTDISA